MVKKMVVYAKTFDRYYHKFNSGNFFSCLLNCKRIWNWSLDQNINTALLILAIYLVLL